MSTLHERLADLAEGAPSGGPGPDLWERGRRYHRRRRLGSLAVAAVVLLLVGGLVGLERSRETSSIEPAGPTPDGALPSRVWRASPFLPGTDAKGPIGQIAVLTDADRTGWRGTTQSMVAISATTGEYRFLDLPDWSQGGRLSPDGRRVAYWFTGSTLGTPLTADGQRPVAGVAVYDAETGDVRRVPIPSQHGLDPQSLLWTDDDHVALAYTVHAGGDDDDAMAQSSSTSVAPPQIWDLDGPDAVHALGDLDEYDQLISSSLRGEVLVSTKAGLVVLDNTGARTATPDVGPAGQLNASALGWEGFVAAPRGQRNPTRMSVFVPDGRRNDVAMTRTTVAVLAWVDTVRLATFNADTRTGARSIRIVIGGPGDPRRVIRLPRDSWTPQIATELLDRPSVDRPAPARPLDPRKVSGGIVLLLLGGAVSIWYWRRHLRA